jgi:cardiolipin synthase
LSLPRVTVATLLTMLRVLLVPVFGVLWIRGLPRPALALFLGAALTDLADGFVARLFRQKSELGALLDPLADKLMLLVSYIVAVTSGAVPMWLAVLVIGRDAVLLLGAALFKFLLPGRHGPERWRPTAIGKYATFSHTLVIALALFTQVGDRAVLEPWLRSVMAGAVILTGLSAAQYFTAGLRALVPVRPKA